MDGDVSHRRSPPPARASRRETRRGARRDVVVMVVVPVVRIGIGRRLEAEAVDPEEQHEPAERGEAEVEDDAVADERQARRRSRSASTTATADARRSGRPSAPRRRWPRSAPGRPLSSSPYLRCQNSSRCVTIGTSSKLCAGVGFGTIHSSERASHGSSPTTRCSRLAFARLETMLMKKMSTDKAMTNAPIVSTKFQKSKP